MKKTNVILGLLFILSTVQAFAMGPVDWITREKPKVIEVSIQNLIEIEAATQQEVSFTELNGRSNTSCWIYNRNRSPVALEAGTKITMRAAYHESEASWGDFTQSGISLSCFGPRTGSEIKRSGFYSVSIKAINEDMSGILKITVK